jgi:hypothetical protein
MRRALVTYNNGDHRSEPHSRIEDWLKHLPASGVRAMCSWERFCAFAREPERRSVAGDATVSVEGASYEVEPELAGETVTLWWGLFDQELFVEFDGKRFGPYQPSRGAIPLYRYRKYQKSRAEERLDKVVQLADQLGLPRAAMTGGDRPLPSLPPAAASMQVRRTPFPEPAVDAAFATPLAARLAISVQLSRPLGSLPEPDRAFIDALLAETLDRTSTHAGARGMCRRADRPAGRRRRVGRLRQNASADPHRGRACARQQSLGREVAGGRQAPHVAAVAHRGHVLRSHTRRPRPGQDPQVTGAA